MTFSPAQRGFLRDHVVQPLVVDPVRFEVRGRFDRAGQQVLHGRLGRVANGVADLDGEARIDFEVVFHEGSVSREPGAQVVNVPHAHAGADGILDPAPILRRKLLVEKLLQRFARDRVGVPQHVDRDGEREGRIGAGPSGPSGHAKSEKNGGVEGDVGQIMRAVGGDRGRACPAHRPGLHRHQAQGGRRLAPISQKPISSASSDTGETSRWMDWNASTTAAPARKVDWVKAATASPLPWPKRWSRSGGRSA